MKDRPPPPVLRAEGGPWLLTDQQLPRCPAALCAVAAVCFRDPRPCRSERYKAPGTSQYRSIARPVPATAGFHTAPAQSPSAPRALSDAALAEPLPMNVKLDHHSAFYRHE